MNLLVLLGELGRVLNFRWEIVPHSLVIVFVIDCIVSDLGIRVIGVWVVRFCGVRTFDGNFFEAVGMECRLPAALVWLVTLWGVTSHSRASSRVVCSISGSEAGSLIVRLLLYQ